MQEFVALPSDGDKAVSESSYQDEDVDDLKDSLKIPERKITRSVAEARAENPSKPRQSSEGRLNSGAH